MHLPGQGNLLMGRYGPAPGVLDGDSVVTEGGSTGSWGVAIFPSGLLCHWGGRTDFFLPPQLCAHLPHSKQGVLEPVHTDLQSQSLKIQEFCKLIVEHSHQ